MIVLTTEELLAINGLLDGKEIQGVQLKPNGATPEGRLQKIEQSMTKKELLINGQLSDKFMETTELLKRYKASKHKVFINNLRIGLIDEDYGVVLELRPTGEITVSYVLRITIVKKYIESSEFLRGGQKATFFDYDKNPCTIDEFEAELECKEWSNMMLVQTYTNHQLRIFKTYCFDDSEAYCYDHQDETKQQRGSQGFRKDLVEILKIETDDDDEGDEFDDDTYH